jgi:hypothetical protein
LTLENVCSRSLGRKEGWKEGRKERTEKEREKERKGKQTTKKKSGPEQPKDWSKSPLVIKKKGAAKRSFAAHQESFFPM